MAADGAEIVRTVRVESGRGLGLSPWRGSGPLSALSTWHHDHLPSSERWCGRSFSPG